MNIIVQRKTEINNTVLGELSIDGKFFCYTLEDKIRDVKIKHETAIPAGTYKVLLTLSQRFKTILPILLNVPGFEGIRIHSGNTIASSSGCVIVGSAIKGETLLHSKTTLQQLLLKMKTAIKKEPITIEIINPVKEVVLPKDNVVSTLTTVVESLPISIVSTESKTNLITLLNTFIQWLMKFYKN